MPTKPAKKPKPEHRPMLEDPHELEWAMFTAADGKIKKKRAAEKKPATQGR